jgi:hypothetical protein
MPLRSYLIVCLMCWPRQALLRMTKLLNGHHISIRGSGTNLEKEGIPSRGDSSSSPLRKEAAVPAYS